MGLRGALFTVLFYLATAFFVVTGLIASIFSHRLALKMVRGWSATHEILAEELLGVHACIEGDIPPGPHLVAVKHQSMYETLAMVRIARSPVIVIKRELADIPFFGWMTRRYGIIAVDRSAGSKALRQMIAEGEIARASGRSVLIFPEGTRVAPGEAPPLQSGFAALYRVLGMPVVPVAMDSGRLFGRSEPRRSGIVTFRIGEVIPPGLPRAEIERRVHAGINALESGAQAGP